MKQWTMEEIKGMESFRGVTQEEERIASMLLDNINRLHGKQLGIDATRKYLMQNEFDRESLKRLIDMVVETSRAGVNIEDNEMMTGIVRKLCEKIFRDHVTRQQATLLSKSVLNRVKIFGSVHKACDSIETYFTQGAVVSVTQTYWEAEKEIEQGAILYNVPESQLG